MNNDNPLANLLISLCRLNKASRDADWQAKTAKEVGILCNEISAISKLPPIDFNTESSKTALQLITLIDFASKAGCKEAKKRQRNLKLHFWNESSPPPIHECIDDQDVRFNAINAISFFKSEWVNNYIINELLKFSRKEELDALLNWHLKSTNDLILSLNILGENEVVKNKLNKPEWLVYFIEFITKNLRKNILLYKIDLIESITKFILYENKEISEEVKDLIIEQTNLLTTLDPSLVTNINFINYYLACSSNKSSKFIESVKTNISKTLNLIRFIKTTNIDANQISLFKSVLDSYCDQIPDKKKFFKAIIANNSDVEKILENNFKVTDQNIQDSELELSLIDLTANWSSIFSEDKESNQKINFNKKIERLLKTVGIERYGVCGDIADYDPFYQELLTQPSHLTGKIKIIKSGFYQKRVNGTHRVLKKSICEQIG